MMRSPNYTQQPWTITYSEIIDVRSPSEYAEDHLPGAINLPVLDDTERAKVGTIYKQVSPFEARKLGASLVAQNVARHLSTHFAAQAKDYHPLVYCWRGGQRSNSLAMVLNQIGWQVTVLQGGYKTYRSYVRQQLDKLPAEFSYKILSGLTGSGKTHILRQLAKRDVQVLDLESIANHRGSLLGQEWEMVRGGEDGAIITPQPSQKHFESLLLKTLQSFDTSKVLWVEAESNKIGQLHLPPSLWENMKQAGCVEVQLSQAARVEWLLREYPHLATHPELLKDKLEYLKSRYGRKKIDEWNSLIDLKQGQALVGDLLENHYDPAYKRSMGKCYNRIECQLAIADLSESSVEALVDELLNLGNYSRRQKAEGRRQKAKD
ncbi:MAG: tRNA 2-selenouridine(34) synthase MnmH [Symploca sp. SIO1A3]|nr:tRNA 2-selenouridine(34) synthase MnmH [Symploca sp. SIO1A3]